MIINPFVSRCKRKFRSYEDLKIKSSGDMLDLFDNAIKEIYRITDDEYDYLADNMNNYEISLFVKENPSFAEKKTLLVIMEKYLTEYFK
jgi:hypothetical protein